MLGAPFPCCQCKVTAVPQYHLAMVDGTIRNFCSYDCVSIYRVRASVTEVNVTSAAINLSSCTVYLTMWLLSSLSLQKSGHPYQPDLANGTSSLKGPSVRDATKPGPSAGASSVPPVPQNYPSSVPCSGHHPGHSSVPPLVPPCPTMSSPSTPGQVQNRATPAQPLKPAEPGPSEAAKLTCHQCSKQFNTKPLLFSHQVSSTGHINNPVLNPQSYLHDLSLTPHSNHHDDRYYCLQGRISMFCSKTCCEQYKTQKNILVLCEYCAQEKVHFDTISYNQQDVVFCSEREFTQDSFSGCSVLTG